MRLALVVNPCAASVTPRMRRTAEDALRASGHEVTVMRTTARDHATELSREAVAGGVEVVVALGGDGTINEVANGVVGTRVALAPLPGGSTNVFARTIGVRNSFPPALAQLRKSLAAHSIRGMPLGTANGRRFLFHTGLGFDAAVVSEVEKRAQLKRTIGQAVFVYATLATLARHYGNDRGRFRVRYDDGKTTDGLYAVIMNSNPYTYFGPFPLDLTRDALPGRGLVAVTVRSLAAPKVAGLLVSAMGGGEMLRRSRNVDHRPDVRSLSITAERPFPYQVDGDYLGEVDSLEIGYEPHSLRIVAPVPDE